jgi:diguanylate cyclase (GGDEF)-like protein/PAS domain S-box-containing protein
MGDDAGRAERWGELADAVDVALLTLRACGDVDVANHEARRLLGIGPGGSVLDADLELLGADGAPLAPEAAPWARALTTGRPASRAVVGVRRDGRSPTWLLVGARPRRDGEDGVVCTLVDVTSQHENEEALRKSEATFRGLTENAPDVIYRLRVRPERELEYVSPSATRVFGYSPEECTANPGLIGLDHPRVGAPRQRALDLVTETDTDYSSLVLRGVRRDGTEIWTEHRVVAMRDAAGDLVAVEGVARDVTELKKVEADLSYRALHDPLTALPNRTLLLDRLERALARMQRYPGLLAVLYLDLDFFKYVNDALGHDAGDAVLKAVGRRVADAVRPSDSVARIGGDEFAAVLADLNSEQQGIAVAERILRAVSAPIDLSGRVRVETVSIGIAFATDDSCTAPDLLRRADSAMYLAKGAGRARLERERPVPANSTGAETLDD